MRKVIGDACICDFEGVICQIFGRVIRVVGSWSRVVGKGEGVNLGPAKGRGGEVFFFQGAGKAWRLEGTEMS
jgi:hypothetical protein